MMTLRYHPLNGLTQADRTSFWTIKNKLLFIIGIHINYTINLMYFSPTGINVTVSLLEEERYIYEVWHIVKRIEWAQFLRFF